MTSKGQVTVPRAVRDAPDLLMLAGSVKVPAGKRGTPWSDVLRAFLDTNVLVRHLTGEPPGQAQRASRYLAGSDELLLADLIVAEVAYVLESYYEAPRAQAATSLRAVLAFPAVRVVDPALLQRAVEVYDVDRLDFSEAYLVACAERAGIGEIASFDRSIDRVPTVRRVGPS